MSSITEGCYARSILFLMYQISPNIIQGWDEFLDTEIDPNHESVVRNTTTPRSQYKHRIAIRESQFRCLRAFCGPKLKQGHEVYI
jgi:hypothetical protein